MYPEFVYLRRSGGYLKVPSIARLDRMFLSAPHPGSGFEPTELFLIPEIFALVLGQLGVILGSPFSKEHEELRELMLGCLPDQAAPK
jgi:hypothetical protein